MLDGVMRRLVSPPLERAGAALAARGVGADQVTLAGLAAALAMGAAVATGHFALALACLVLSRIADGLDGAVARHSRLSDFGGILDIVCDFAFYAAVPVGFALVDGAACAVPAAVLLASFYLNAASFLGFAAVAAKRGYTQLPRQRSRQLLDADFERFDLLIAMDRQNLDNLRRQCPPEHQHKLHLLLEFAPQLDVDEVPDPYYGNVAGFERVLDLCESGVSGLLAHLAGAQ